MKYFLWIGFFLLMTGQALALEMPQNIRTEIVSDHRAVTKGQTVTVGVKFMMSSGWHIYWRNPGDSGIPTSIEWKAPDGVEVSPLNWPAPHIMVIPEITSYGYETEVVLFSEFKIPADYSGKEVPVSAEVKWLGCEKICVPGKSSVALSIPVWQTPEKNPEGDALIAKYRLQVPAIAAISGKAEISSDTISLTFPGPIGAEIVFFPYSDRLIQHPAQQSFVKLDAGIRLDVKRSLNGQVPDRIDGVLAIDNRAYEAFFEVPKKSSEKSLNSGIIMPLTMVILLGMLMAFLIKKSPK